MGVSTRFYGIPRGRTEFRRTAREVLKSLSSLIFVRSLVMYVTCRPDAGFLISYLTNPLRGYHCTVSYIVYYKIYDSIPNHSRRRVCQPDIYGGMTSRPVPWDPARYNEFPIRYVPRKVPVGIRGNFCVVFDENSRHSMVYPMIASREFPWGFRHELLYWQSSC